MYIPPHFNEGRIDVLHDAIRQGGLASLVTMTAIGMIASHLPLLLDPDPAPYGTLIGHLARANPQTNLTDPAVQAMVVFHGPDGYISPSLYATKQETGKVVPTWNYVAIHAYGTIEFFDDPARLLNVVTRLTDQYENPRSARSSCGLLTPRSNSTPTMSPCDSAMSAMSENPARTNWTRSPKRASATREAAMAASSRSIPMSRRSDRASRSSPA